MGSAEVLAAPTEKVQFMEDMKAEVGIDCSSYTPSFGDLCFVLLRVFYFLAPPCIIQTFSETVYFFSIYFMCFVFSSLSFWTSMDVPAGVTQEEGNTGFSIHLLSAVLALIFLARRIQPFLSLVDREVEFCVLTI